MINSLTKLSHGEAYRSKCYLQKSKTPLQRFWEKVDKKGPVPSHVPEIGNCWVWLGCINKFGYGEFQYKSFHHMAPHRWIYQEINGALGELHCCHKCDNRACVRPAHLFSGTAKDNAQDKERKGRGNHPIPKQKPQKISRVRKGVNTWNAKLDDSKVIEIRKILDSKTVSQYEIAIKFGVCQAVISGIKMGKIWTHVLKI